MRQAIGDADYQSKGDDGKQHLVSAEQRMQDEVVDEPAADEDAEADGRPCPDADVAHAHVNEPAAHVVKKHEQKEAAQPSDCGLPTKPVQLALKLQPFALLDDVEAAAVNHPYLTGPARAVVPLLLLRETTVEPSEVVRTADPEDAREDVYPARQKVEPFAHVGVYSHSGLAPAIG
jgi:hypothetical protein